MDLVLCVIIYNMQCMVKTFAIYNYFAFALENNFKTSQLGKQIRVICRFLSTRDVMISILILLVLL